MKKLILILLLIAGIAKGQDFTYKLRLVNVTNIEEAKLVTDHLRNAFKTFPTFIDSTNTFQFNSNVNTTKIELVNYLNQYGYTISFFGKVMREEIIFINEELEK